MIFDLLLIFTIVIDYSTFIDKNKNKITIILIVSFTNQALLNTPFLEQYFDSTHTGLSFVKVVLVTIDKVTEVIRYVERYHF